MTKKITSDFPCLIIRNLIMIDPNGKKDEQQLLCGEKPDLFQMAELFN
jgi:hypothetical protein